MIGLPIFEITAPSFNQSLCGVDEHEGATSKLIGSNCSAINALVAPITIKMMRAL